MAQLISDQISDLYLMANYAQNVECLALKGQSPNTWLDCYTQGCVRGILGEKHWWSVRACETGRGIQSEARLGLPRPPPPAPGAIIGEADILLPTSLWEQRGALGREQPGGYTARMTALGWIHSFVGLGVVLRLNCKGDRITCSFVSEGAGPGSSHPI